MPSEVIYKVVAPISGLDDFEVACNAFVLGLRESKLKWFEAKAHANGSLFGCAGFGKRLPVSVQKRWDAIGIKLTPRTRYRDSDLFQVRTASDGCISGYSWPKQRMIREYRKAVAESGDAERCALLLPSPALAIGTELPGRTPFSAHNPSRGAVGLRHTDGIVSALVTHPSDSSEWLGSADGPACAARKTRHPEVPREQIQATGTMALDSA